MPVEMFERLVNWANIHGAPAGRPYFSRDGVRPMSGDEWATMRSKFYCPHGVTNVWDRNALRGEERIAAPEGRAVHLNQKPLELMKRIISASSDIGDVVWEPFGGLFTGAVATYQLERQAYAGEVDGTYFQYGLQRLKEAVKQPSLI